MHAKNWKCFQKPFDKRFQSYHELKLNFVLLKFSNRWVVSAFQTLFNELNWPKVYVKATFYTFYSNFNVLFLFYFAKLFNIKSKQNLEAFMLKNIYII